MTLPSHDEVVLDGSLVEVGKLFPECLLIVDNLVSHVAHWSVQEGSHHVRSQTYNGSVEMKMMDILVRAKCIIIEDDSIRGVGNLS